VSEGSARPIDEQIATAVRDGVRAEAAPVGRHLAEVRGMSVRAIRQLERIEANLGAERSARVDDLSILIDLFTAGWRSVDERLARIEELLCLFHEQMGGDERLDVIGLMGSEQDALSAEEQDAISLPHAQADAA
jgi:hypothetical protein